jgi:hypothetical protein
VDEQKLAELFRAAAADTPPAAFDAHDVVAASRRITARRRSLIAGGSALAGVVLVVGLVVGLGHTGDSGVPASSAAAGSARTGTPGANRAQPMMPDEDIPNPTPKQGGDGAGRTGGNAAGCGPTDGQLAAALANELPSVGARTTVPNTITCPADTRSAAYRVSGGTVGVLLIPAGESGVRVDPGVVTSPHRTASGASLIVFSAPDVGSGITPNTSHPETAPDAGQLAGVATGLAARF